jgi:hypothetical protein
MLASAATLVVAAGGYPILGRGKLRRVLLVRWLLLSVTGGMAGYILYALQVIRPEAWGILPEIAWIARAAVAVVAGIGAILPLGPLARSTRETRT